MIKEVLDKIINKKELSYQTLRRIFLGIMEKKFTPSQVAAFLTALRCKPNSLNEIRALAKVMRGKALKLRVQTKKGEPLLDTCGTGGKPVKTFNISTAVALVVAAAGVKVAKHGNRSFSGVCGSMDIIEALGVNIEAPPQRVESAIKEIGIGFLYAPLYHPAMKNVALVRRELGIRTIFNIAGPLTNPAGATHQLLGVAERNLTEVLAKVLQSLGVKRAFVVWGEDVYDEISITGKTKVSYLNNKRIRTFYLTPQDFGLKRGRFSQLKVSTLAENIEIIKRVLEGKANASQLNIVLANASACFFLTGLVRNLKEGVKLAKDTIEKGKALEKLFQLKEFLS